MYYLPATAFVSILLLTSLAYLPGLNGPFLLDDFGSVAALDTYGGVYNWETFHLFVFGDHTGPLGRPVSVLSFLLDGTSFDAPWRFKFTNLILHLLNGVLLCWLVLKLESIRTQGQRQQRSACVAVLVAGAWLLHPFNVSTTLYVVQRMAQLSSLFVLLGMVVYLHGRQLLARAPRQAYTLMSIAIVLCGALAVMSKENGCLLPLLILVLEATVLRGKGPFPGSLWRTFFLIVPLLSILVYVGYYIGSGRFHEGYELRDFNWAERLLTEARVLWDYLGSWFSPGLMPRGVYADDYPYSTGLFSPKQTLYAVIGVLALLSVAISRKVWPILRLAVLFFLTGHLLESTILPLELYFEHRNYLPAMLLFYPLILMMGYLLQSRLLRYSMGVFCIITLAVVTAQRASLWGDEYALAEASVKNYPYSQRANRVLANLLEKQGRPDLAMERLLAAEKRLPDSIPIKMHLLSLSCVTGKDMQARYSSLDDAMRVVPYDFRSYALLESVVMLIHESGCAELDPATAHALLDGLESNSGIRGRVGPKRQIYHLRGVLYARENRGKQALNAFLGAQTYYPDVDAGLLEVAVLATNGLYDEALDLLDRIEAITVKEGKKFSWQASLDYPAEIARLRTIIRQDIVNRQAEEKS